MANLYKIATKSQGLQLLNENAIQSRIRLDKNRRKMILKARQFGVSTGCILDFFDDVCFSNNLTCVILAHEKGALERLFRIVLTAYENLPPEFRPIVDRGGGSKHELFFRKQNSRIYVDLEVRGGTIQRLHVSEAAFMKDPDRLKATLEAVPLDGRVNIETTPNGFNHFYDSWVDPDSNFSKLFFPWYVHPEYTLPSPKPIQLTEEEEKFVKKAKKLYGVTITRGQIMFRRMKQADLKDKFIQEYPEDDQTCFLASGGAAMDLIKISQMLLSAPKPLFDNGWRRDYEPFDKTKIYVAGADCAEGVGGDKSHMTLINATDMTVAMTLHGNWRPAEFAKRMSDALADFTGTQFGAPLLAVERNNHGHTALYALQELGYPHLFHREKKGVDGKPSLDPNPGWVTDKITRPPLVDDFIEAVEEGYLHVRDRIILGECLTLVDHDGKIEAEEGKHDDGIISCSIALQMALKHSNIEVYRDIKSKIFVD